MKSSESSDILYISSEFHVMCFPTRILLCLLTTNAASSVSLAISNMKYYSSVISDLPTPPPPVPIHPCPIFLCTWRS